MTVSFEVSIDLTISLDVQNYTIDIGRNDTDGGRDLRLALNLAEAETLLFKLPKAVTALKDCLNKKNSVSRKNAD